MFRTAFLSLMLMGAMMPGPSLAAVRVCQKVVSSDVVSAPTELAAKKLAMAQWRAKAVKAGANFGIWRLAAQKSQKCFPKGAGFECVAFGAPCIIQHNPNQRPSGPDGKGVPL
jgi:hypothetical protein